MVLAGTNDISINCNKGQLIDSVLSLVESTANTRLLVFGIPFRNDKKYLNGLISQVNDDISKVFSSFKHAKFVSLASLHMYRYYTKYGLHFIIFGKKQVVDLMYNSVVLSS